MDFDLLGSLGWREGLIAIIALLVLYIIVLFVRMRGLRQSALPPPTLAAQSALAAYTAIQEPESAAAAPVTPAPPPETALPGGPPLSEALPEVSARAASDEPGRPAMPDFAWNEPPPEIPGQALIDALQREVYQLRCEMKDLRNELRGELRAEVLAVREDFRRQSAQSTASEQSASPQYKDAMQMAMQGEDATTIAHRCGIARAEADLVVALARNRQQAG